MSLDVRLLVDGQWVSAETGKTLPVVNPADGQEIGRVAHASIRDLDAAVAGAIKGFQTWKAMTAWERFEIMRRAAEGLRVEADRIASIMTREQGKPLGEAKTEILAAANIIEYFGEEGRRVCDTIVPARIHGAEQRVMHRPIGIVAAFTPWNFPINQIARKLGAALAAGCAIIVKGPEDTPASPAALFEVLVKAGVPAGVISLVFGDPAEISSHLIKDPNIRKISFTGSTPVGKHLAAMAGAEMKPMTMELGGHAPVIVCEDADIEAAAEKLCQAKFRNAGQVCISPTRFLLQDTVADSFLEAFVRNMSRIRVGSGLEEGVTMGPLIGKRRVDALKELLDDACSKGARMTRVHNDIPEGASFFPPTVLENVDLSMRIMHEEPFGPVVLISRFSDLDAAINEANRLPYGLAAYAYTQNERTQRLLGEAVESGMMAINHHGLGAPEVPFGGIKDSGYGTEGGTEAIKAHCTLRFVTRLNGDLV